MLYSKKRKTESKRIHQAGPYWEGLFDGGIHVIIFLYLTVLAIGVFIGSRSLMRSSRMNWINWLLNASLVGLIFLMGVSIGLDETVLTSFRTIGFQALVLVLFIITFSILSVKLVARFVLPRKGEVE